MTEQELYALYPRKEQSESPKERKERFDNKMFELELKKINEEFPTNQKP